MKKIVVTGGSGRLGQFVIRDLLSHGYDVHPREFKLETIVAQVIVARLLPRGNYGCDINPLFFATVDVVANYYIYLWLIIFFCYIQ